MKRSGRRWRIVVTLATGLTVWATFSLAALAEECGMPPEVCHSIAPHAGEGDMVKRTTEAYVVHHADFMTFLPFKSRLEI